MGIVEIVGVCRFIVSGRMLPPELPASARATDTDYQWFDVGPHSIRTPESIAATGWVAVRRGEMPTVMSDGAEFVQHHNLRLYQRPLYGSSMRRSLKVAADGSGRLSMGLVMPDRIALENDLAIMRGLSQLAIGDAEAELRRQIVVTEEALKVLVPREDGTEIIRQALGEMKRARGKVS